jgi:C4-dicarboxylate transporter DctM subunit
MIAIPQNFFSGIGYFPLLAIPFYILAGEIMNKGKITERLIRFAMLLIGKIPGSLAHANIVTSMFFGGITGSAQADTSCVGGVMIPAMVDEGYTPEFSVAVTAASSTIGPIIPPSIMMVLYGVTVGCSISALFMGGFIPGVLIGFAEMGIVVILNRKHKFPVQKANFTKKEKLKILKDALLPMGMPVIIVGGIVGGVVTPTEAGVLAVVYSIIVSVFVIRTVKWKDLPHMMLHAATISATILMIIACAKVASYALTALQMSTLVGDLFLSISDSPYVFLMLVNVLLLIMGMFMDGGASVLLLAPILAPIASMLGINMIHFGLVMVMNLVIGWERRRLEPASTLRAALRTSRFPEGSKRLCRLSWRKSPCF